MNTFNVAVCYIYRVVLNRTQQLDENRDAGLSIDQIIGLKMLHDGVAGG